MINFKKAVSMVVVFSLVLCSCGDKRPLDRDGESRSKKEEAKNEEISKGNEENPKEDKNMLSGLCQSNYSGCIENTKCGKKCNEEKTDDLRIKCIEDCKLVVSKAKDVKSCEDTFSACNQNVESKFKEKADPEVQVQPKAGQEQPAAQQGWRSWWIAKTLGFGEKGNNQQPVDPAAQALQQELDNVEKAFKGKYRDYKYDKKVKALAQQVLDKKISEQDALEKAEKRVKELQPVDLAAQELQQELDNVEKVFEGKYRDYKYDHRVRMLAYKVSTGKISKEEALKEAEERVKGLPKPVEIIGETETNFEKEVLDEDKLVIVYFFEESCPYYKEVTPAANEFASHIFEFGHSENAKVYKVDAKKNKALVEKYKDKIKSYPTLLMLVFIEGDGGKDMRRISYEGKDSIDISNNMYLVDRFLTKYGK